MTDGGTAEGGEVGSGVQGIGEVGDQSPNVGAAATRDGEGCRTGICVVSDEFESVNFDRTALALDVRAAAVGLIEALSLDLDGGGHRRRLPEVADEVSGGGGYSVLLGE